MEGVLMSKFFLVPGAEGWNLISRPAENGNWRVRAFPTLDEAAQTLSTDDSVVLALPVSAVLAQRMRLPSVEGSELREMVRIQLEKSLPFSAEEVTSDFEVIEQANGECVVSAIAVQNQRLQAIAAPLLTMTAELQGINASFENVLVDEKCFNLRDRVESALAAPAELMSIETPPA